MARIGFIGLGTMGSRIAGHLAQRHSVSVFNRSPAKTETWLMEFAGEAAATPKEAGQGKDFVVTCVGNDDDLRAVTLGANGVLAGMADGATLIDHSTVSTAVVREIQRAATEVSVSVMDAPVSGGEPGARSGTLTIMCGGDTLTYQRSEPILACYAKKMKHLGDVGSGQLAKMVNQICIAGVIQSLAEGIRFAQKAGLDVDAVMETISSGSAQSWQMENRYKTMAQGEFDFGFAVELMRKDLSICLAEAVALGASLPTTTQIDGYLAEIEQSGGRRWDVSSLITRLPD